MVPAAGATTGILRDAIAADSACRTAASAIVTRRIAILTSGCSFVKWACFSARSARAACSSASARACAASMDGSPIAWPDPPATSDGEIVFRLSSI